MSIPSERPPRIGLAGPSCSGKSTVARIVAERLGAARLCLDDFYLRGHERRHVVVEGVPVRSFDHPGAYDGEAVRRAVADAPGAVVAEGFLLLAYPGMAQVLDLGVFVDLPWDEIRRRRALRTGQTTSKVDASFDLVGEREWLAHGAAQAGKPGILRLDGMRPPGELAEVVLAAVRT
jgi:uridine kinase